MAASAHQYPFSGWCCSFVCETAIQSLSCSLNLEKSNPAHQLLGWNKPLRVVLWASVFKLVAGSPETLYVQKLKCFFSTPELYTLPWLKIKTMRERQKNSSFLSVSVLLTFVQWYFLFSKWNHNSDLSSTRTTKLLALVTEIEPEI